MFDLARVEAKAQGASEIVPYWVYGVEGGARIERHVFALPLSREHAQAERLRSSLAVYRMVFGQPRQDDLVRHLVALLGHEEIEAIARETTISRTRGEYQSHTRSYDTPYYGGVVGRPVRRADARRPSGDSLGRPTPRRRVTCRRWHPRSSPRVASERRSRCTSDLPRSR